MTSAAHRTAVVTGASSGIGKEAARALAARGWNVIGTGRDPGRMATAEAELRAAATGGSVTMVKADHSLIAGSKRLADAIAGLTGRIDVLINNAGGMTDALRMTSEGLEENFASNHVAPFVLTRGLLPLLYAAAAEFAAWRHAHRDDCVRYQRNDPGHQPRRHAEPWGLGSGACLLHRQARQCAVRSGACRTTGGERDRCPCLCARRGGIEFLYLCLRADPRARQRTGDGDHGAGRGHAGLAGDGRGTGPVQRALLGEARGQAAQPGGRQTRQWSSGSGRRAKSWLPASQLETEREQVLYRA